jgi:hypothetical protein
LLASDLARRSQDDLSEVNKESPMNRLDTIADRQRKSKMRDLMFAAFIVMAAAIGVTSVGAAISGASSQHLVQR